MQFVLDNSVAMRWLFADGDASAQSYAEHVLSLLADADARALVPGIWSLEVANVIARAERQGVLKESRAAEFIGLLDEMAIERDPETAARALGDSLQLARRFGLSAYDASYLELSLRTGLPLATLDADLRRALEATGATLA